VRRFVGASALQKEALAQNKRKEESRTMVPRDALLLKASKFINKDNYIA
jgi:hypothetical protein